MEKQDWKQKFKCEVEKLLSVLGKSQKFKEFVAETRDNYYAKMESININVLISEFKSQNQREMSIFKMAMYLWEYEGKFSFCINVLCFLLISNGHDLFDTDRKKYAKSFEDIENIGIYTKSNFLVEHGFVMFDEKENKNLKKFKKLRNDIAHYKFIIRDDGEIIVYNNTTKNWEELSLLSIHEELMDFASDMLLILWEMSLL